MQLLKLSYNCLNYDFIGTSTDESSDDLCTVQIPTSWRSGNRGDGSRAAFASLCSPAFVHTITKTQARCCGSVICYPSISCSVSWFLHSTTLFQFVSFHPSVPFPIGTFAPITLTLSGLACDACLFWDSKLCLCSGVILSSPDCLRQEVSFQQRRTSQVPFTSGGRSKEDTSKPSGLRRSVASATSWLALLFDDVTCFFSISVFARSQQLPRILPSSGEAEE